MNREFTYKPFPHMYTSGGQLLVKFKGSIAIEAPGAMNAKEQEQLGEKFAEHLETFMRAEGLLQFTFLTIALTGEEYLAHSFVVHDSK